MWPLGGAPGGRTVRFFSGESELHFALLFDKIIEYVLFFTVQLLNKRP